MSAPTRRGALGLVLGAGIGLGLGPAAALAQSRITLPEGPQLLTRRIERSLSDGEWIKVSRRWEVAFSRQGQSIALTGQQLDCEVDAPPSLAPLTAIEKSRSTAEMWPILLNGSGLIFAAGNGVAARDVDKAIEVAQRMIAERPIPASERSALREHLAIVRRTSSSLLEQLPDDLFFPVAGPMRAVRPITLPGGMVGEFELSYSATAAPGRGWLDRAERLIVTRLAGTEQIAREYWELREG